MQSYCPLLNLEIVGADFSSLTLILSVLLEPGGMGGNPPPPILKDHLTRSQPGEQIMPNISLLKSIRF